MQLSIAVASLPEGAFDAGGRETSDAQPKERIKAVIRNIDMTGERVFLMMTTSSQSNHFSFK